MMEFDAVERAAECVRILSEHGGERVFIYALLDPRNDRVRYIGSSKNPMSRYESHLYNKHLASWVNELRQAGLKPRMITLADVYGAGAAEELEYIYIYEYQKRQGDLLNKRDRLSLTEKWYWYAKSLRTVRAIFSIYRHKLHMLRSLKQRGLS